MSAALNALARAAGWALLILATSMLFFTAAAQTTSAFASADAPVLWWAGRSSGFVAYLALWLSMLFGTLASAKSTLIDRKLTMELHRQWSLAAVIGTVAHIVLVVVNEHSELSWLAAVVPFTAERLTGAMALGVFAVWGLALVEVTSLIQRALPYGVWRAIHALAFGTMLLALVHSVVAGSDTGVLAVRALYAVTAAILGGAIAGRATSAVLGATRRRHGASIA